MAKQSKTPRKQGAGRPSAAAQGTSSSGKTGESASTAKTSRKTLRTSTAPYARKAGDDDDGPPPKGSSGSSDGDKDKDKAGDASAAKGKPEADTDTGKGGPAAAKSGDDDTGKSTGPAPEVRTTTPPPRPTPPPPADPATVPAEPHPIEASEVAQLLPPTAIDADWDPDADAPPPGLAPRGDSRSFRRGHGKDEEFLLIYRYKSFLITRAGPVGKMGRWTVVDYPNLGSAAHAYAQECSTLRADGFLDLR